MDSPNIPLWVEVLILFLVAAGIFFLAAWEMVLDWISDATRRLVRNGRRKV